jgi:hypothetical protein
MTANEFGVDRVDSLHNIASATPAAGENDQKRKKDRRGSRNPATEEEKAIMDAEGGLNVKEEPHLIDFEA